VNPQLTYKITQPVATHWRPATCAEVDCGAWLHGWRTVVPTGSPQAAYIRADRSRHHLEEPLPGGLVEFTFGPGQTCFASDSHRVPLGRPQVFRVAPTQGGLVSGDVRTHSNGADWVEDFSIHLDQLRTIRERG
jgi:hypothetical protein